MAGGRFTGMAIQQSNSVFVPDDKPQPEAPEFREYPLSKKDQRLQAKLQKKVDQYDKAEGVDHNAFGAQRQPPRVVITGTKHDPVAAKYDSDGIISVSQAEAHNKKARDFDLAHEVAHQKDHGDQNDEKRANIEAARVVGPQKAIDSIHTRHKTNPEMDDPNFVAQDIYNHGTTIDSEKDIQKNFPNQKLKMPKHSSAIKP